jgi:L-amino acid N-acyltransferase YncA
VSEIVKIRTVRDKDRDAVIKIFNHYAVNGYAAYPDQPVTDHFFSYLREGSFSFFVLEAPSGVIGFGLSKPLLPFPAFASCGVLTYFILPDYTNRGLGTRLLSRLTSDAKKQGLEMVVANMSSRNEASIGFHRKNGFTESGKLHNVGTKFGKPFDIIWMQKEI